MCRVRSNKRVRNHKGRREWGIQLRTTVAKTQAERMMMEKRTETDRLALLQQFQRGMTNHHFFP